MPNRDYFTRPTQAGGRTVHDYGHTKLGYPEVGSEVPWWAWCLSAAAFVGGILYLLPEVV